MVTFRIKNYRAEVQNSCHHRADLATLGMTEVEDGRGGGGDGLVASTSERRDFPAFPFEPYPIQLDLMARWRAARLMMARESGQSEQ